MKNIPQCIAILALAGMLALTGCGLVGPGNGGGEDDDGENRAHRIMQPAPHVPDVSTSAYALRTA